MQQRGHCSDFDSLGDITQLQSNIDADTVTSGYDDALLLGFSKSRRYDGHGVDSRLKQRPHVFTDVVRYYCVRQPSGVLNDGDFGIWDTRALGIGDRAGYGSKAALRVYANSEEC